MDGNNFAMHLHMLKRCNKVYNAVSILYVAGCGMYAIAAVYLMLISMNGDILYLLFAGPVSKSALLVCGYLGTYKKNDMFAMAAPCIMIISLFIPECFHSIGNYFDIFMGIVISGFSIDAIYLAASVILAAVTIITNRKYRYLEEQEGFPYFNERFELQKAGGSQYGSSVREQVEERKKTQHSDMDEI